MASGHSREHASSLVAAQGWVAILTLLYVGLWLAPTGVDLGMSRYLPMHTSMETLSIVIAMLVFGIAWNAYSESRPGNIVLIGAVFLGVTLLDFAHMLSYGGMPDLVTPSSPQKSISFWLAARYLAALGMLVAAIRPWTPMSRPRDRHLWLFGSTAFAALCYWLVLFQPARIPTFFIAGSGLTPIKIYLEYGLVAMNVAAAILFLRRARAGAAFNATALFAAAAITALSELCFTLYSSMSDLFNMAGHIYKVVAYWFIYRAIFVENVHQPFKALHSALDEEKRLMAEQRSFVTTLDMLDEAVLELGSDGRIISANSGWWRLAGLEPRPGLSLLETVHEEDRPVWEMTLHQLANCEKSEVTGRFRLTDKSNADRWIECRFVAERDSAATLCRVRGVLRDITKSYLQERHITHMALHDALTGLPNRVLLEDRLHYAIEQAPRHKTMVAVCFIDLDHFKNINDNYGHKTGDALLVTIAKVLKNNLRNADTLARWGGDEFVVVLTDVTNQEGVAQVVEKLIGAIRQEIELEGMEVNVTCSIGIALYPDDGDSVDVLLSQADRAMFYAKSQARNNYQFFGDMSRKGLGKKELYIQSRLAHAIRNECITVWYQPQVEISERGSRIIGVEALARWHDEDLGWISPGTFIPMAENLGLITEMGQLVWHQALHQFQAWRQHHPELHLSVNVSKRQLFAHGFVDMLLEDAQRYGIPPAALTLEVTESVALMDVEYAEDRLKHLAAAGFILSIDDFGTGYASLSQLHELPVQELKIDISFVRRVHTPEGLRMVQAIVNLAQALRLQTVAEGIEDERTAATMRNLGVTLMQGYHFGKPVSAEEMGQLLGTGRS